MLRKKLAAFLVAAMVLTTSVPAVFAADTAVNTPSAITSEVSTASEETTTSDSAISSEDSATSEETITSDSANASEDSTVSEETIVSDSAIDSEDSATSEAKTSDSVNVSKDAATSEAITSDSAIDSEDSTKSDNLKNQESQEVKQEATTTEQQVVQPILMTEAEKTVKIDKTKDSIMYKHLVKLSSDIGTRVAGTDKEIEAKDYIKGVFESLGYDTSNQTFHWERKNREGTIVKEGDSANVIAVKKGKTDKQIIVGAHYDSVDASTGASDNASGVSVMLGAAEALKDVSTDYTIKFIAFGAEEVGLKGSTYYAEHMSKDEVAKTIAMINLDTVLFGDKMYVYGNLGREGWLRDQTLDLSKKLDLDVITQQGLNLEFPKGTTGDWSDHQPFADLGLPWIYFESTNWDLFYTNGDYSTGEHETEKFGEIMHTERDNISFMDENFPGRMEDRLYTYTTLLSKILVEINPSLAKDDIVVSTHNLSMSKAKTVEVSVEFKDVPSDVNNLEWIFGGKPFDEWKVLKCEGRDGSSKKTETNISFITFAEEPKIEGKNIIAKIKFDLPFGTDNLSTRPYPRRIYPDYLGDYQLVVKDNSTGKQVKTTMKVNAFDSYHKQTEIRPTVEEIINTARKDRYIEYAPLGKSAEGREIPFVIFSRSKSDVDTYLNDTLPMMLENPTEMLSKIESEGIEKYKPVIWFNNIHSDEANGVDAQIDLLTKLSRSNEITFNSASETVKGVFKDNDGNDYTYGNYEKGEPEEKTLDVQSLLDNFIIVFSLNNNPDGRFYNSREMVSGFDPNRDVTYQTQVETAQVFQALAKWSPMIFNDYHGFVEDFLIEPCTPPHEPNFEYDLLMNYEHEHANVIGRAGIANTKYDHYIIPMDDYGQGWDDGAPMYAAVLSLLHGAIGHTVEIPELNQESNNAFMYAGLGTLNYALENKKDLFENQVKIYERGVNGIDAKEVDKWLVNGKGQTIGRPRGDNENFFPEYYVIPVNEQLQKNALAAYEMADFLIKNGVKVEKTKADVKIGDITYPSGSFIVPMHQAKRGFANCVLYDGCDFSDFSSMYAEVTMCFPALRGFDKYEIRVEAAFDGKTDSISKVTIPTTELPSDSDKIVINNTNNDVIKAVNELLSNGKKVSMIYEAGDNFKKGDFIVAKPDLESVKDKYFLETVALKGTPSIKEIKQPKVAANGDEVTYVLKNLGFNLVDSYTDADVIVDENGDYPSSDIRNAIGNGTSFIGVGGYSLLGFDDYNLLPGLEVKKYSDWWYEGVLKSDLNTDSVITGNYGKEDILYNNSATWIEKVPKSAKVLATISNKDDFYVAGWWPNHDELKGKPYIIQDQLGNVKVTLFATHITNKAHNSHQFRLLANAIYDSPLKIEKTSHHKKHSSSKTTVKPNEEKTEEQVKTDQPATKNNFKDVSSSSWYSSAVNYVIEKGIMKGLDSNTFAPNVKTNRAMIVTMLYRLEGQPTAGKATFSDVNSSKWYGDSVAWASNNGVVTGYENNKFNPNADLTREQLAVILYRYAQYKKADMTKKGNLDTFSDNSQVSSYAKESIAWAVGNGIITGKNGNALDPKGSATRAEIATMLQRFESIMK